MYDDDGTYRYADPYQEALCDYDEFNERAMRNDTFDLDDHGPARYGFGAEDEIFGKDWP